MTRHFELPIGSVELRTLSRQQVSAHVDALVDIAHDVDGEYWTGEHFLTERPKKWHLSFAAWLDDRPVGYAILSQKSTKCIHLHHFMVASSMRHKGLGALMVAEMEQRVQNCGLQELTLKVAKANRKAQKFYQGLGYAALVQEDDYLVLGKLLISAHQIVAIHQPNYAPWLGYFHKIAQADIFVFLDDAQYTKNSVINRVRVLKDGAARWLTLSVRAHLGDAINAVRPAQADWSARHCDALSQFYRGAPCFRDVWPEVRSIYRSIPEDANLAAINRYLIEAMAKRLGLTARFLASSEIDTKGTQSTERLIAIVTALAPDGTYLSGRGGAKYQDETAFELSGITLEYTAFNQPRYRQGSDEFLEGLSFLDAVFHVGWSETAMMVAGA